jgi:probable addiction module antidote protein
MIQKRQAIYFQDTTPGKEPAKEFWKRRVKMAKGSNFQNHLELELKDPDFAASYLAAALDEGDDVFISEALAKITKVHGATALSSETGIARQALYKICSSE